MTFIRGITNMTIFSMLVVLIGGQFSPFSLAYSSNESSVQAATTTISFQDGVYPTSSYRGTRDTMLSEDDPNRNFGRYTQLGIDGDDPPGSKKDRAILLSWDLTEIPKFSSIKSASITLSFDTRANGPYSNHSYSLYALKRDWNEGQATWNKYRTNYFWNRPGALSTNDRSFPIGSFIPRQGPIQTIVLDSRGLSVVQDWVNNPASNYGFIIASATSTDGADFLSSETSRRTDRPKLSIRYQPKETISKPPKNYYSRSSLFQNHSVPTSAVQATVYRSNTAYGKFPIRLELNRTVRLNGSVSDIYKFDLGAFDRNSTIYYSISNSQGSRLGSWTITPKEIIDNPTGVPFFFGMGEPSGSYTVNFTQGYRNATAQLTVPEQDKPALEIWPDCVSPGQQLLLLVAGLRKGTPLDIYRHDHNSGLRSYYKYMNTLPAPNVNERGEAYYYLQTRTNDPRDSFLIIARDKTTEIHFSLLCR